MVAFKRAVAIWAHVCVEVQPSIFFLHICSLQLHKIARLKDESKWCELQDVLTTQKFEDDVHGLTTRMFECFDYITDKLKMLTEKVDAGDHITEKLNTFTEKVDAFDDITEKLNMLTDKVDAVDDIMEKLNTDKVDAVDD